jgi:8-oxo-dGTP pyrophosphatase MutT (NUDIX family)
MQYSVAIEKLTSAFKRPLPGDAAHQRTATRPRRDWPAGFDSARARHAAGLLLLFPVNDRAFIVLTVRAGTLERHRGQISLPGGAVEVGETFEHAALREAREEIGLQTEIVRVLGALTPIAIPVSGFRLHPVVAATDERPVLSPAGDEVAEILEVSIEQLLAPGCLTESERVREGHQIVAPAFAIGAHEIWGATAMVLAEFLVLLGWT